MKRVMNTPEYKQGYQDGISGIKPTSNNPNYMVGYEYARDCEERRQLHQDRMLGEER